MIKSLIDKVRIIANSWEEDLEPPASKSELNNFAEKLYKSYAVEMLSQYQSFLEIANGLEFNGLIIYGTKNSENGPDASPLDFFEMNEAFQDSLRGDMLNVVIIGEDSTGVLTYEKNISLFQYRDRIGLDRVELFPSFEKMLEIEIDKVLITQHY